MRELETQISEALSLQQNLRSSQQSSVPRSSPLRKMLSFVESNAYVPFQLDSVSRHGSYWRTGLPVRLTSKVRTA